MGPAPSAQYPAAAVILSGSGGGAEGGRGIRDRPRVTSQKAGQAWGGTAPKPTVPHPLRTEACLRLLSGRSFDTQFHTARFLSTGTCFLMAVCGHMYTHIHTQWYTYPVPPGQGG